MADSILRVPKQDIIATSGGNNGIARVQSEQIIVTGGEVASRLRVQYANVVLTTAGINTVAARVQHTNVIAVCAVGVIPPLPETLSSFAYNLDGHYNYGIHVEGYGTYVLDRTTGQWSQYASGDLELWNARYHEKWGDKFYASSLLDSTLLEIDPDAILDDSFRSNQFTVTGRVESQSRRYIKNPEAQLFGSVGLRGGAINLSFSDDEGDTFSPTRTVSVAPGARDANVMFYDLGSVRAPGRVFKITDEGTLRRIQSLKVILGDGDVDS